MNNIIFPFPGEDNFPLDGFVPIGSSKNPFKGRLLSPYNQTLIINFYIRMISEDWDFVGLFEAISN